MKRSLSLKTVLTLSILLLLAATHFQPLHTLIYANPAVQAADNRAAAYLDETFNKALVAFAAARATNAIISLLQDSELTLPLITIAVGEVLDPLNDLVERFSWVMLVSLTSIGIQKTLLQLGPWVSIHLILSLSLVLYLAALWSNKRMHLYTLTLGNRLLFAALLIRFCVPAIVWINAQTYDHFLVDDYQRAAEHINHHTAQLKTFQQELTTAENSHDKSLWQRTKDTVVGTFSPDEWQQRFLRIEATATEMITSFLKLIVVFLLQTVILPLIFLWGLLLLLKTMVGDTLAGRSGQRFIEKIAEMKTTDATAQSLSIKTDVTRSKE